MKFENQNILRYRDYNLIYGVLQNRSYIKKYPEAEITSYTKIRLPFFIVKCTLFITSLYISLSIKNKILIIGTVFVFILCLLDLLHFLFFYLSLHYYNRFVTTSKTLISKKGIVDKSDGKEFRVEWKAVELIVIQNNSAIVIIKDSLIYIYFTVLNEKEFVEYVKSCDENVCIIRK